MLCDIFFPHLATLTELRYYEAPNKKMEQNQDD